MVGLCKLFRVIVLDLFVMIILEVCSFEKVMNKLILVDMVYFSVFGIKLISLLCNLESVSRMKRILVIKIFVKVVC